MTLFERDRQLLDRDRRLAQVSSEPLPETLIFMGETVILELRRIEELPGIARLVAAQAPGQELQSVSLKSFDQTFSLEGDNTSWTVIPMQSPATGKVLLGEQLQYKRRIDISANENMQPDATDKIESLLQQLDAEQDPLQSAILDDIVLEAIVSDIEKQISSFEGLLQKIMHIVQIHKEAVQDAVDIVQTKRLDFKDVPVSNHTSGFVSALFFYALLEFNIVGAVGTAATVGVSKLLRRIFVGPSGKIAGRARGKILLRAKREATQQYRKNVTDLTQSVKKIEEANFQRFATINEKLAKKAQKRFAPLQDVQKAVNSDKLLKVRSAQLNKLRQEKEKAENTFPIVKEDKGSIDFFSKVAGSAPDFGKNLSTTLYKASPSGSLASASKQDDPTSPKNENTESRTDHRKIIFNQNLLPLDVVLKTQVSSIFDDALIELEGGIVAAKNALQSMKEMAQTDLDRSLLGRLYLQTLVIIPTFVDMDSRINEFNTEITDWQQLKQRITGEYEFIVWTLLFSGKVKVVYHRLKGNPYMGFASWTKINKEDYERIEEDIKKNRGDHAPIYIERALRRIVPKIGEFRPMLDYLNRRFFDEKLKETDVAETLSNIQEATNTLLDGLNKDSEIETIMENFMLIDDTMQFPADNEPEPENPNTNST